ncbi:hypothetical protein TspCOW1_07430 [Thiohalobacter sp. COW1]|uniref:helix-turn-helix transcriptional regulator n=1 Tax=Thiohalobacter sp. COW1 TaxID=2795687 RepID=UPI0019155C9C|nr:AlpA family phage regulatory protein [Thiohalobacter sp. COW1]BCO30640.1 hypothetical protein TspCOW1_07430 [Thiohalobacter sp. COW1]
MRYITDRQIADRLAVSRATIWRWSQAGKFPKPVKLAPGTTRWRLSDVERWELERSVKGAA